MKTDKIVKLLVDNDLNIYDVLDATIKENGIIGVGLITLADEIKEYIHSRIKPMSQDEWSR
jgi:hypothetical protein|tara:strand:- start:187 stop:369 length:183 start_codon:yes stop_codon:yes gene_type:complete